MMNKMIWAMALCTSMSVAHAQPVPWVAETSPVPSGQAGDPCITMPGLVVGPDPIQNGVYLWDLSGVPLTPRPDGLARSADARGNVVVVSSTTFNSLLVYQANGTGLSPVEPPIVVSNPNQVALASMGDGGFEAWVDTSNGEIQHLAFGIGAAGVSSTPLGVITMPEVPAGLAVDERTSRLYVAQPSTGVLAVDADGGTSLLIALDGGALGPAVGGLDVYLAADGSVLLFSASPAVGFEGVAVHRVQNTSVSYLGTLQPQEPLGGPGRLSNPRFVTVSQAQRPGFSRGALVVQDGVAANYKIVSLDAVHQVIPLPAPWGGTPPESDGGTNASDAGLPSVGVSTGNGGRSPGATPGADLQVPPCGCETVTGAWASALGLMGWWFSRRRSKR